MPYCSSEGKMQGYEDDLEFEVDTDVVENQVTASITMNRLCAGCGSTSSVGQLEISVEIEHNCTEQVEGGDEPEFEIISGFDTDDCSTIDRTEKGRRGKRFIGVEISGTVQCSLCEESIELTANDELQASAFEVEQH